MEYCSVKYTINQIIDDSLIELRELNEVKCICKNSFEGRLSEFDSLYIEDKYVELLLSKWLLQAPKQTVVPIEPDHLLDFTKQLGSIKTFSQCSILSTKCKYSDLIVKLYDKSSRLQALEDESVLQFKRSCLDHIQLRIGEIQLHNHSFFAEFVSVLKDFVDLDEICSLLKIKDFLTGIFTFENLVANLLKIRTSDDNIIKLQKAAQLCSLQDNSHLVNNLREVFLKFLEPIDVKEFSADGRSILEVAGSHIVLSKALQLIQSERIKEIDEIRFVKALVLHANVDLTKSIWKGKNLVISSETLIINNDGIVWDVSGKNGEVSSDCVKYNKHGMNGSDGMHGESGGNVLVMVDESKGGDLIIMSNGGNGSKGLDGSKGVDGEDGFYINGLQLKSEFPPVSSYFNSTKIKNCTTSKRNILNSLKLVKIFYYNGTTLFNLEPKCLTNWLGKEDLEDFYINAVTKEGCEITFSFYYGKFSIYRCQSHLLYKGAPGGQGQPGGKGGRGGCGGLAGDIEVHINSSSSSCKVKCIRNNGKDGEDGKPGVDGKPGISGADCGYVDWSLSTNSPLIFVTNPNDDKQLKIVYSDNSTSSSVYCPYKNQYAEIKEAGKEFRTTQQYNVFNRSMFSTTKKEQIRVARKKTIDLKNMIGQYKTNTFSSFDKLHDSLEMVKQVVAEMIDNELQTEQMTFELKITRQISYIDRPHDRRCKVIELHSQDEIEPIQKNVSKYKYQGMKYKLKILNDIANQHFNKVSPETEFEIDSNFLSSIGNDCNKIFSVNKQPTDLVSKYFCKNSEETIMETKNFLEDCETIHQCVVIAFIKSIGRLKPGSKASEYLNNYCCFEKEREIKINNVFMVPIINVLKQTKASELYSQLRKSILMKDHGLLVEFLSNLKEDQFLNKLYGKYQEEAGKTYDWSHAVNDEGLRKEMSEEIIRGPRAEFYREFLSYKFDCNILYFTIDQNENISLLSNHNPTAKNKIYVLFKDTKFYELTVNAGITQLLRYQKVRGSLYSKILLHVDSLADKEDLDRYAVKSPFNCDTYVGINKRTASLVKFGHIIKQDSDINAIKRIFSSEENTSIATRLEKMKVEYIGYTNILHYMALHFENDGKSITTRELCFIFNFTLWCALTMPTSLPLVTWIIAAFPPKEWLIEITLLKLEIYFEGGLDNERKVKWRCFLTNENKKLILMAFFEKICDKNCSNCSINQIEDILHLMSCIPKVLVGLEHIDLGDWRNLLRDKYWLYQLKAVSYWPEDFVNQLSFYFVTLENSTGFEEANKLLDIVIQHAREVVSELDRTCVLNVIRDLVYKDINLDSSFLETLSTITMRDWKCKIKEKCFESENERSLQQLAQLIQTCSFTSNKIKQNLSSIMILLANVITKNDEIYKEFSNEEKLNQCIHLIKKFKPKDIDKISWESLTNYKTDSILNSMMPTFLSKVFRKNDDKKFSKEENLNDYAEIIMTIITFAINNKYNGINLRNTQILAIMIFLKHEQNLLAQISTGEGKSLIIVCIAIIKAIAGQKVDIITSSHVLAQRDSIEYSEVYKLFGLSVGHNCSDNLEERRKIYSTCQVVYGDLSNFQRDYLLDRAYDKNILGDRNFDILLVDEVDSLLLDRANNTLYLSHEIPGLDKLEPLFVYIWKWLNTPTAQSVHELKENILISLGQINKDCLRELDYTLTETKVNELCKMLVKNEIISESGLMLKDQIDYEKLDNETKDYINISHLKYMCKKVLNNDRPFEIPNYLKGFVLRHLDKWIENAQVAMCMENGRDYVVDVNRSGTSVDRSPNITILDSDTGTDQANSQWENGLHQFLQLKHGCKHFSISLKAVFISNVSFIKKYKRLYGLSGTLGTSMERKLLQHLYGVNYVMIPTAKAKQFSEIVPITCKNQSDWIIAIFNSVFELVKTRSVLIICESVNEVMSLKCYFKKMLKDRGASFIEVNTYTRDYEKLKIADNLQPGQIIISTNLAGRGTDIKLSADLIEAGGLHVCLSFLPKNIRVEEQAFGRVARNGQPGSAQMIFISGCSNSISKTVDLKKQRDLDERHRVINLKNSYETQILIEEQSFEKFLETFTNLKKQMDQSESVKSLLLQICLDKWAYWLDENGDNIASVSIDSFIQDVSKLLQEDITKDCCITDPFQLSKLGFIYLQDEKYETAKILFDKVIKEDKYFSEIAQYYKLFVKAREGIDLSNKSDISDLLDSFSMVETVFKKRISSSLMSSHFIDWMKNRDDNSIMQIESYKEQQVQKSKIYNMFLQSLYDIIGHGILPSSVRGILQASSHKDFLDEFTAFRVYSKCVEKGMIQKPQLKPFEESSLTCMLQYGIHPQKMYDILKDSESVIENIFVKSKGLKVNKDMSKIKPLLPSRELFWKELLNKGVLEKEMKYLFIDFIRLEKEVPYLTTVISQLATDVPLGVKNSIWLYKKEDTKQKNINSDWVVFKKCKLLSVIGDETYKFLKKKGIVYKNKQAVFSSSPWWTKPLKFTKFDSLIESDFKELEIDETVAKGITSELEELKIIKARFEARRRGNWRISRGYTPTYSLTSNEENINKLQLTKHMSYNTSDVQSLLLYHFSFCIAYKKLVYLVNEFGLDGEKLCLPLQCYENAKGIGSISVKSKGLIENKDESLSYDMSKLKSLLPSRELFWNELLKGNILESEVEYLSIDFNRLEKEVPYLTTVISQLPKDVPLGVKNSFWLYKKDEIKQTNSNTDWVVFIKCKLLSVIGDETYKYLKKKGIVYKNKQAVFSSSPWWTKPLKFTKFDSLIESDFKELDIDETIAKSIISELEQMKIIKATSITSTFSLTRGYTPTYSLTSNEENINKIQLSKHPAYTNDVQSLLTNHFSFRIAYQKLVYLVNEFGLDGEKLCLPLQCYLHKSFFAQLQENFLTEPKVNFNQSKDWQKIFPQSMNLKQWEDCFNTFFSQSYAKEIVESLQNCKWLVKNYIGSTYYINHTEVLNDNKSFNYGLNQPEDLPSDLQGYKKYIEYILINYLILSKNITIFEKGMNSYIGEMYFKDTPRFYFKPLILVLKESYKPTSECSAFILNGLDHIMVVDEKLYSKKMFMNTAIVTMIGITEIAAGAALMVLFPPIGQIAGGFLISEGMGDLIYSTSCLFSGMFSSHDYFINKIISLSLSAVSSGSSLIRMYKSIHGERTVGSSIKSIMKNIKGLFVKETAEHTGVTNAIIKKIVKTGSISVGLGMKTAMMDQVITPQLEKLEEILVSVIYTNIDTTIVEHDVIQFVRGVYYRFGETKTKEIVQDCFQNVINENKSDACKNFKTVSSLCQTLINDCFVEKRLYISKKGGDLDYFLKTVETVSNIIKIIKTSDTCWATIRTAISELLDKFQQNLEHKLKDEQPETDINIIEKDCEHFIFVSTEIWKKKIKKLLCNNISQIIVSPILQYSSNQLSSQLLKYTLGKPSFFSDIEVQELAKSKPKLEHGNKLNVEIIPDNNNFVDVEYNELLLTLMKTDRHASIFSEICKRNFPVDTNCIEICCEIVPTLLKKEGLDIPPVKIIVDIDGVEKHFISAPVGSNFTTIYLSTNQSILANILNNRSQCIKSIVHQISKSVLPTQFLPFLDATVDKILRTIEINESMPNLSETRQITFNKPTMGYVEHMNTTEIEKKLPYQHKGWRFKSYVDVDLREESLTCSNTVEYCVFKGFDAALQKINQHISTLVQSSKINLKLSLQDFCELYYEIWPETNQFSNFPFVCQPVCYELVLPLPLDTKGNIRQFVITMRLNSQVNKKANSPQGAHILYEMQPLDTTSHLDKSMRGHVLLNPKCERLTHTIKKCLVAGELIVPTGFKFPLIQEECDVLIIGDKQFKKRYFKYIVKHSKLGYKYFQYQNMKLSDIKQEIINACKLYKGIQCVVLYFGTESVDLSDEAVVIVQTISEIVIELKNCLRSFNIILCSFRIKKQETHSEIINKTEDINKTLVSLCKEMNLSYVNKNFSSHNYYMIRKICDCIVKEISCKVDDKL